MIRRSEIYLSRTMHLLHVLLEWALYRLSFVVEKDLSQSFICFHFSLMFLKPDTCRYVVMF